MADIQDHFALYKSIQEMFIEFLEVFLEYTSELVLSNAGFI